MSRMKSQPRAIEDGCGCRQSVAALSSKDCEAKDSGRRGNNAVAFSSVPCPYPLLERQKPDKHVRASPYKVSERLHLQIIDSFGLGVNPTSGS